MDLRNGSTVGGRRIATKDDILKLEELIANSGGGSGGGSGEEGLLIYKMEILSSLGDRFMNGKIDTWLEARIYRGIRDVTDILISNLDYKFSWERLSGNASADEVWANNRLNHYKQHITKADVPGNRCTFRCRLIDSTTNTIILES